MAYLSAKARGNTYACLSYQSSHSKSAGVHPSACPSVNSVRAIFSMSVSSSLIKEQHISMLKDVRQPKPTSLSPFSKCSPNSLYRAGVRGSIAPPSATGRGTSFSHVLRSFPPSDEGFKYGKYCIA